MTTRDKKRLSVRKSLKKRRERLKREGNCVDCGNKSRPNRTTCQKCCNDRVDRERGSKPKKAPILTPEQREAISSAYVPGVVAFSQVAARFGITAHYVKKVIREGENV